MLWFGVQAVVLQCAHRMWTDRAEYTPAACPTTKIPGLPEW